MSQVRNLRAMFENKGDTSPPDDRGRSSGATTPVPGGTESPRPLSKVRTNFVAIEKDGRIGLRRDPSHESSVSRRRLSMETDAESVSTVPDKSTVASDEVVKPSRTLLNEPIPESPRQPPEVDKKTSDLGAVSDKPSLNPDKHVDEESSPALLTPADPTEKTPARETKESKATSTPAAVNGKQKTEKAKEPASTAPTKTAAAKKTTTTRPTAISTKSTTLKPPAKSPSAPKTPTSAIHKPATKPAAKKEPAGSARTGTAATRPTVSNVTKKPPPVKTSVSDTGFVKPKPKSPTKPVALPASLMAPTASSVSKGSVPRQSLSRQSNHSQTLNASARPASRASMSAANSSLSAGKTVKRQASSINRPRPSLGPPPKKPADDHPVTKKEAHVDESFLARMMRPTQASAQKTTDKVPVTPPRKTAKRPSSAADHKLRRETSLKSLGSAKKPARTHAASTASSEATGSLISAEPVPKQVQPKKVTPRPPPMNEDRPQTPKNPGEEPEPVSTISAQEVAVETANVETSQEAIELAKEADLVAETTAPEGSVPEVNVEEPTSLEQLKVELADAKPAEGAADQPDVLETKSHDDEGSVTVIENELQGEKQEKSEDIIEAQNETPVADVNGSEEAEKDEAVADIRLEDASLEKGMEQLKLDGEKPIEENFVEVEKEDTAAN